LARREGDRELVGGGQRAATARGHQGAVAGGALEGVSSWAACMLGEFAGRSRSRCPWPPSEPGQCAHADNRDDHPGDDDEVPEADVKLAEAGVEPPHAGTATLAG